VNAAALRQLLSKYLNGPDDEALGKALLACWMGDQLESQGIDLRQIPRAAAERLVEATLPLERDDVEMMPYARALSLVTQGEYARGGKVFRDAVSAEAVRANEAGAAKLGTRIRKQRREYSKKGNEKRAADAERKRQEWLKIGKPLRAKHPDKSNSWLAAEIAKKFPGTKKSSIRVAIPSLGLSRQQN
jgi:hypothetical protein